jgi:hypothetical protein
MAFAEAILQIKKPGSKKPVFEKQEGQNSFSGMVALGKNAKGGEE